MQITTGKKQSAMKFVIYGAEGIGKSTFLSQAPNVLFIDTEGSTDELDVSRLPTPTSWQMLLDSIAYVRNNPNVCSTLVIDTADWAEMQCAEHVCAKQKKESIEDFGYGKGFTYLTEEFAKLLHLLDEVQAKGVHVGLSAHAKMRKFEQPDEMGAYDRWELKLSKNVAPLVKEWAKLVLFANYRTVVVKQKEGKSKAQGGERVMYTSHHPCWDAKNRHGLPEVIPLSFDSVTHLFTSGSAPAQAPAPVTSAPATSNNPPQQNFTASPPPDANPFPEVIPPYVHPQLADLMKMHGVTVGEIELAVTEKGYFPLGTEISQYPRDFVEGCLIAGWQGLHGYIVETQKNIPF